jgi:hypothetical protein
MSLDPFGAWSDILGSIDVEAEMLDGAFDAAHQVVGDTHTAAPLEVFEEDGELVMGVDSREPEAAKAVHRAEYGDLDNPGNGAVAMAAKRVVPLASGYAAQNLSRALSL